MWKWIEWLLDLLVGGSKRSATDQQLGRAAQQRDDATASNQEAQRAQQIDQKVHGDSDAALDAELQRTIDASGKQ